MGYSILSGWPFVFANKFHIFVEEIPKPLKKRLYTFVFSMAMAIVACQPTPDVPDNDDSTQQQPDEQTPEVVVPDTTPKKLMGEIIGSRYSVDYSTDASSVTVNTKDNVFDGDFTTFFASYDRSGTWVGLDLGEKHVITKVGYSPRINQAKRVQLAVIEGANNENFSDAMPIYLIPEPGVEREMTYADLNCSRGFRYVRYMTPNDVRCNLAELEFFGYKSEGDDSQLYQVTNLPLVVINTEYNVDIVSKELEIPSTVYVIGDGGKYLHAAEKTGVRGRGNASWNFPKKPYRLKFDKKVNLLGAPAKAKKWTLINNYGDKTLMRNLLAFEISRRIGAHYTPFSQPVDVILNGEYRGCYQLCDQIEVAQGRVDITEMEPEDNSGEALTGGYLIEIDAYADQETSYFYSNKRTPVTIKSPDEDEITASQKNYINSYFNQMEIAVFNSSSTNSDYTKYLDLDSFLRHFIVGELSGNTDTYWSVYMSKERGDEKFKTGPVWDFDLAFDNDKRTYPVSQFSDFLYATSSSSMAGSNMRSFVSHIVKDSDVARKRLAEIWSEQRNAGTISVESLIEYVDQTAAELEQSQRLNFLRWPILNEKVHQNPQALGSYSAEVETVRKYLRSRVPFLDSKIK